MPEAVNGDRARSGRLEGKVAIVAGSAMGLGAEIAKLYAEEGAAVVLADIATTEGERTAAAIKAGGGSAVFVRTDVRDSASVAAVVATAEERFGRLDIMTANQMGRLNPASAEHPPGWGGSRFICDEELDFVMDVNFGGTYRCFAYALPAILRAGGGAMTATASLAGMVGWASSPIYAASKGAIISMIRTFVAEYGESVRVNAVCPGAVDTGSHNSEWPERLRGQLLWGRWAHPREVAQCHLFLASPESSFVNGQVLVADGGQSAVVAGTPPIR
jgi:NAD(P)-dependent dehydrogenase (short-subunit alcohol dehydrogenase family)